MTLLLAASLALAQDDDGGRASDCQAFVGLVVPVSVERRDWDLSASQRVMPLPHYTASCFVGGLWVGVDVQPGVTHRYDELAGRGPFVTTVSAGFPLLGNENRRLTSWFFANRSARGLGLAYVQRFGDHAFQVRAGMTPGVVPTILASVQVTPAKARRLFADRGTRLGFEIGTMNAVRGSVRLIDPDRGVAVLMGVRGGMLHRPQREVFFRPVLLATAVLLGQGEDLSIAFLQASAGTVRWDGEWRPAWGVALPVGGPSVRFTFGPLIVHGRERLHAFTDIAFTLSW